jgi:hypothetical protein
VSARKIVIAGSVAQRPREGGHTWVFLQYLLGFRRLGWEVLFIDWLDPAMCSDAARQPCAIDDSLNLTRFLEVMHRFGLGDSFALLCRGESREIGRSRGEVIEFTRNAACLINIMGFLNDEEILASAQRRVFLDIDPGFPQMWKELGLTDLFRGHDDFVTIGENIGRSDGEIPTCGFKWITTPQPVVLEEWPPQAERAGARFTAIATWRGAYGPVEYNGKTYGLRVHEFRKFIELPARSGRKFELALDIHSAETADLQRLRDNGWQLVDPKLAASDPWAYRTYLQSSYAELMIAKNMYVATRSGWFSDRSICYLACGRPVLAQDTGFSQNYPVGRGLVSFNTFDEAVAGVHEISQNYDMHQREARNLAETYFDSKVVLTRLLEKLRLA